MITFGFLFEHHILYYNIMVIYEQNHFFCQRVDIAKFMLFIDVTVIFSRARKIQGNLRKNFIV